jgi:PAS domain S-box-containing protein
MSIYPDANQVSSSTLLNQLAVAFVVTDISADITSINPLAAQALGYEPHEMIGRNLFDFIAPEGVALIASIRKKFFETGSCPGCDVQFLRKDGTTLWCRSSSTLHKTTIGGQLYAMSTVVDISSMKELEQRQ